MNFSDISDVTKGKIKTTGVSPFLELEIEKVFPNPEQPRKQFDDIEELAENIKEHGLLQPITVVKKDDKYMIVSGERRYKAHLYNKAKTIIALILTSSDEQVEELTLIENIQRSDLTDFEVAKYILKLWQSGRYAKKSDLATRIGKSDTFVSKAFSSLKLNSEILEDIEQNKKDIPLSVMDEIRRVKDPTLQKEVYGKYNNGDITRNEIRTLKEPKNQKRYDDGVFEILEENNFAGENKGTNIYTKKFFDLFTFDEYVKEYGVNNANLISFARSLKIGDKVICNFERFSVIAEIKEKAGMEAVVLETSNWFYVRILFKDGTEHNIQVYDIAILNGKKVNPYNFNQIIYSVQKNEDEENKQKFVCYGNGCHNEIGQYISITIGDLEGNFLVSSEYKELIRKSITNNYKITIEEV